MKEIEVLVEVHDEITNIKKKNLRNLIMKD